MAIVIFDDTFTNNFSNSIMQGGGAGTQFNDAYARLSVYTSGSALSQIPTLTDRDSVDALTSGRLWWTGTTTSFITLDTNSGGDGFYQVSCGYRTADANGVAAEFLFYATDGSGGTETAQIIGGTVTTPGGGGELIIGDVNIVSGASYRLNNWIFKIFQDFTV